MPAEALRRTIETMQLTDAEIRRVTRNASQEADRIIRSLEGNQGVGARVRSTQISIAKANAEMWASVKDATVVGIGDAVDAASDYQSLFDERMFAKAGVSQTFWRQSMLATGREGIESLISRREGGFTLSERVYRNRALSQGHVAKAIDNGLLLGKTPAEIARDVKKYIDPNVPGGASYAAMRLGRSEVVNAYHTTSVRNYQQTPWIERVKWNLSGSHTRPDECNEYADSSHFARGLPGEFRPHEVPSKPHPNCLCYVTPVMMDLDQYAKNFQAGKYDNYIQEQLGCSRVA